MTTATPGTHSTPVVAPGVRRAVQASLAVGAVAVIAAAFVDRPAVAGAVIGATMVLVFFGFGAIVVNTVAGLVPGAALIIALLTYTLEVVGLALVFWMLTRSGATDHDVDRVWLGFTTMAGTLGWVAGQTWGALRGDGRT